MGKKAKFGAISSLNAINLENVREDTVKSLIKKEEKNHITVKVELDILI
jgi:hypothetical protein